MRHTRSSSTSFDFQKNCFLCAFPVTARENQNKAASCVESRFPEIEKKILVCNRGYDDWVLTVYGRIESVNEMHAADAIYHHVCYSNFNTGKQVPSKYNKLNKPSESGGKRGRPKDTLLDHAYAKVRSFLTEEELNDEQVTLSELMAYMNELV